MTKKTTEEFITEAKRVHGDFYDYSKVVYKSNKKKVNITCPVHGPFDQNAKSHLKGSGCPKCSVERRKSLPPKKYKPRITQESFLKQAKTIHSDFYDYSKVICKNGHEGVTITCPLHGDFVQKPVNHLKGYGCPYCSGIRITNKSFVEKAKRVHGNRYDYSKVSVKNGHEKVKIICPEHGSFWQSPEKHCSGRGCPSCWQERRKFIKRNTTSEIIDRAINTLGHKYDYSRVRYTSRRNKVEIICPEHGSFWQSPENHISGHEGCPLCSARKVSKQESDIRSFIEDELGITTVTSNRSVISPYELDIYIPDHNLAIEFNGLYWHSTAVKKDRKYHLRKTQMCEEKGIRLIHIYEDEWLYKSERIKDMLTSILRPETVTKYNARQCKVGMVHTSTAKAFLEKNHIQGYASSSIKIGLFYNDDLIAYMGFVKVSDSSYNLNRFCTTGLVRGGFSKLLSYMVDSFNPSLIISYADRRWSQGGVYEKCGFSKTIVSNPSFDYVNHNFRYNRQQFMKKYLPAKFPDTYDPSLTEWENMELQGYYQIWNCGYIKYELSF